jgi:hypothetical protein
MVKKRIQRRLLSRTHIFIGGGVFLVLVMSFWAIKNFNLSASAASGSPPILDLRFDENSGTNTYDSSGNENNGVFVSSPSWVGGKFGSALQFRNLNGSEDRVNAGSNSVIDNLPLGDFTVEGWVKFPQIPTQGGYFGIINKIVGEENGWWMIISRSGADGTYELSYFGRMTEGARRVNSGGLIPIEIGKWHHIGMVYMSGEKKARLFFDGSEITYTRQGIGQGGPADDSTGNLSIGRYRTTNSPHALDDIKIYKYARTDQQIANDANAVNVKEFGAIGDGIAEDQAAFQAAVDYLKSEGGGRMYVPAGTYILHKTTTGWNGTFNMIAANNIEMFGDGRELSTLKRKDVIPTGDTHIVRVINSDNIWFHDLGFDGSRATGNQDQMHGVYVLNSNDILLEKLKITRVRGSGTYLIGGNDAFCSAPPCKTTNVTIKDNIFNDNYRAGSANQGGIENIHYLGNQYSNTGPGQAIDFEPTGNRPGVQNLLISGNDLGSSGGSKILTIGGTDVPARNVNVTGNTMIGGVQIARTDGIEFSNNIVNAGNSRSLELRGSVNNAVFENNHLESSGVEVIHMIGGNVSNIDFENNNIYQLSSIPGANTQAGIYSEGVGEHDFRVLNNNFVGPEGASTPVWGVLFRNVAGDGLTRQNFQISGNKFWRMPKQISITTNNINSKYENVTIQDNVYYSNNGGSFSVGYDPTDPASYIINLVSGNNIVAPEIPSP